jgi:hypothetical protein
MNKSQRTKSGEYGSKIGIFILAGNQFNESAVWKGTITMQTKSAYPTEDSVFFNKCAAVEVLELRGLLFVLKDQICVV